MPVTTARNAKTTTSTTPVVFKTVGKVGHVTLFNSENVSFNFAPTRRNQLGFLFFVLVAFAICYLASARVHAKTTAALPDSLSLPKNGALKNYFDSLWSVCFLQKGQYLLRVNLSGSFFLFLMLS